MGSGEWKRIGSTEIHKVGYRTIVTKQFELPTGEIVSFDTVGVEGQNDVGVIAVTRDRRVVVAKLFRPGPERIMIEIPGGFVDPGETPKDAGMRELGEEVGYEPSDDSEIVEYEPVPQQDGYSNSQKNYFLITNVVPGNRQKRELEETIETDTVSIPELIDNAKRGRMTDAIAVLMAYDDLLKIENGGQE